MWTDRNHASSFWKGIIYAAQALKFGYRWVVGKFGFGKIAGLVLPLWLLNSGTYVLCHEKTKVIADIWVDGELRLTFRRNFDDHLFQIWQELLAVVENVELKDETDSLVWCYSQSGVYSVQTFYAIINFRGVKPMFVHAVWSIEVPPKFSCFSGYCPQ
jgi:hypothetical protein